MAYVDDFFKRLVKEEGKENVKDAGITATALCYAIGISFNDAVRRSKTTDFSEVAEMAEFNQKEVDYFEDMFYKKNSWLNKEG